LWLVHVVDTLLPIQLQAYGLRPRELDGLAGIACMPFLHGSWGHLFANTVPLVVLLILLAGSQAHAISVTLGLIVTSGLLLWVFGRSAIHIGASGLVYGLVAFLIASGLFERRLFSLLIAVVVGGLYGSSMLWGVLPIAGTHVSWDGHLAGAVAGVLLSYAMTRGAETEPAGTSGLQGSEG
jgi:membrane associated rhomboid family serine protease